MQPIVNGLEIDYEEIVEFQRINAETKEGSEIFRGYGFFGHPSYLVLDGQGDILWKSVGEQPAEVIIEAFETALENL